MQVLVTREDLVHVSDEGTVWVLEGTDTETRDRVRFGGDWRAAQAYGEAVEAEGEAVAEVEPWQVLERRPCRRAVLRADSEQAACKLARQVKNYLPSNYQVVGCHGGVVTVEGHDRFGWTLEDYVLPRLASGLLHAEEVKCQPAEVSA